MHNCKWQAREKAKSFKMIVLQFNHSYTFYTADYTQIAFQILLLLIESENFYLVLHVSESPYNLKLVRYFRNRI